MHIVFPLFSLEMSGGLRVTFQYIAALFERDHQISVLVPDDARGDYFQLSDGIKVITVKTPRLFGRRLYPLMVLLFALKTPRCNVLVANSWQTMLPSWLASVRLKSRLVFLVQHHDALVQGRQGGRTGVRGWINERLAKLTYRLPATRIAVSSWVSEVLTTQYGKVSVVVPNGVDVSRFQPQSEAARYGEPAQNIMVLGRKAHWKGFDEALEAIRLARKSNPRLRMLLVTRDDLPLPNDIPFEKKVPRNDDELRACYCQADIFLYTSRLEGFGLPPLEAMACERPVVTTDCGGVKDFAQHEKNCLMVRPQDPAEQAKGILRLSEDPKLAGRLAKQGRETALRFTQEIANAKFCRVIESLRASCT
jgi:glycosyltransferase involved in cell wall biosynthesis